MNPLITLSIPIFNVEKYLEKALESALNQTYDNLEILVIDDKGTDNSMELVRNIIASHPRGNIVRIIEHDKNQGLGATRNTSIENAQGEYIFFMDSDDYISYNCIELLYKAIAETNADMAVGSYAAILADGSLNKNYVYGYQVEDGHSPMEKWISSPNFYVPVWNKLYKTEFLRKYNVKCIPSNRNEDVFFTFQLISIVKKIVFIPHITYLHLIENPNSIMNKTKQSPFDEWSHNQYIDILDKMLNYIIQHDLKTHRAVVEYFKLYYRNRIYYIINNTYISGKLKARYLNDIKSLKAYKKIGEFDRARISLLLSVAPSSFVEMAYRLRCKLNNFLK